MQNVRRHVHGDVDGSNTPENATVTSDLPARGAVLRMGEPEGSQDQTDASDACIYAQSTVRDSRKPANASEHVRTPQNASKTLNSPGRNAETRRGARGTWKPIGCIGRAHARTMIELTQN